MDLNAAFAALGIALGLGLLVGIQRERAEPDLAGVRTFPLITVLGVVCAMIGTAAGAWIIAAGLIGLAATIAMGDWLRPRPKQSPGITTEVAILLMYTVGAMLWLYPDARAVPVAVGVGCALLLHLKSRLHGLVARVTDDDQRAIMRFALVTFIVLPVLPDRTFGPLDVLNPRQVWWMVVLVVGIGLVGYVASKLLPRSLGILASGGLGGLISSTATTASFARSARAVPDTVPAAALIILIASAVVFVRVGAEVAVVSPGFLRSVAPPLGVMFVVTAASAWWLWFRTQRHLEHRDHTTNPSELGAAIKFAAIYAAVLWLTAAARIHLGPGGIFAVAAISGLADMDAITLTNARLVGSGQLDGSVAARSIVIALIANLIFKAVLAGTLGGPALLRRLMVPTVLVVLAAAGLLVFWPW